MSNIQVLVSKTVIDNISVEPYNALAPFHLTMVSYCNGQNYDDDYIAFTDGGKDFEAQGNLEGMLKLPSIVSLKQGFGDLLIVNNIQSFIVMASSFFENETNTVPSGFPNDTWDELDEEGELVATHNTSWKKWAEINNRTPRYNVAGDELMFGLNPSGEYLKDTDYATLQSTYSIWNLTTKQFEASPSVKVYTSPDIKVLLQDPSWTQIEE